MAEDNKNKFAGKWHCRYWYPSNTHSGEDVSKYEVTIHQNGSTLILESLPNKEDSYMFARMVVDGDLVTGTWHESTSPTGEFEGSIYSGALQLLLNQAGEMQGKWVGVGQEGGVRHIYTGNWEITKLS